MNDLISKSQSFIEWKEDFKDFVEGLDIPRDDYKGIMAYIDEVPSVEPRKKGEWIDKSDDIDGAWNYCSVCGEQAIDLYDFCPNCGSYNGGEEE